MVGAHISGASSRPGVDAETNVASLMDNIPSIGHHLDHGDGLERTTSQMSADVSVRSHTSSLQDQLASPTVVKDITFWGGLCLLICNTTGPGAVTLPLVAQSAGWMPTIIGFVLVGLLSYLSSLFICEAMTEVPGNDHFQANVEFSNLVLCFFGRRYQVFVQIICFLAMQTTNIASIAICSQLFDNLLIRIFHRTCGIQVYPSVALVCVSEQLPSASPFSGVLIMSTGALVALIMIVPLCLMNLSENIWLQIGSCILILLISLQWTVTFFIHGLEPARVPAIGSDMSQTFGSILFNYASVTAVPSLANAKKANVSIHKTVGSSMSIMTVLYLTVSILGGMAFEIPADSTMIQAISASPDVTTLSQIAGYTFPIAALITSIPVNIIVLRYNLIQSGTCNKGWSNVLAGALPWLVALPCMTGSGLTNAVGWSSLFFVSAANFVIPFVLYIYSKKYKEKLRQMSKVERMQEELLSSEARMKTVMDRNEVSSETSDSGWKRLMLWSRDTAAAAHPGVQDKACHQDLQQGLEEKSQGWIDTYGQEQDVSDAETLSKTDHVDGVGFASKDLSSQTAHGESSALYHQSVARSHGVHIEAIAPPFLGGNNYTIPGFGICLARPSSNLDVDIQHLRSDGEETLQQGTGLMEPEDRLPQHCGELDTIWSMRALPKWAPVSGITVAHCALAVLLIGISATIM
ncbi:hypothetical protein BC939DRAFT_475710 [Gamsiella multidivaricata]|uniref:uncharacterized protein n=1 Tax=Gamsiella multidivaricata TaxID=101098 RepID=UPI002220C66A|nr:uncharacterized protein BC939DRAFT_475710 [Gamsiella multidivaricata]KAI7826505.1 hypothetical protein BC939DRAFT_475710 [Gamsiella multidivaricata]